MKITALIVDDHHENLGVLVDVLTKAGIRVLVAEDGESALAIAARQDPDVVLLDIGLPGIDGFETCRRLRQQQRDVPILFVTALEQTADRMRGFMAGGDDYVTKPFRADEVLARTRAYATVRALRRQVRDARRFLDQGDVAAARAALDDADVGRPV